MRIKKAHKVTRTTKNRINELKKKHPDALKENIYFPKFADYLKEEEEKIVKKENVVTFIFQDNIYPDNKGNVYTPEEFFKKFKFSNFHPETHQQGNGLTIENDLDIGGVVMIPDIYEFINDDPEGLYSQYIAIFENSK
jgi:hypothetical protein